MAGCLVLCAIINSAAVAQDPNAALIEVLKDSKINKNKKAQLIRDYSAQIDSKSADALLDFLETADLWMYDDLTDLLSARQYGRQVQERLCKIIVAQPMDAERIKAALRASANLSRDAKAHAQHHSALSSSLLVVMTRSLENDSILALLDCFEYLVWADPLKLKSFISRALRNERADVQRRTLAWLLEPGNLYLTEEDIDALIDLSDGKDEQVRAEVDQLLKLITHRTPDPVLTWQLWWRAEKDKYSVEAAAAAVIRQKEGDANERYYALVQLGYAYDKNPKNDEAENVLKTIVEDVAEDVGMRSTAAGSLCAKNALRIPEKSEAILEILLKVLQKRDDPLSSMCPALIAKIPGATEKSKVQNIFSRTFRDKQISQNVRLMAAKYISAQDRLAFAREIFVFLMEEEQVRNAGLSLLVKVTGKDFGRDKQAWRDYLHNVSPLAKAENKARMEQPIAAQNALFQVQFDRIQLSRIAVFNDAGNATESSQTLAVQFKVKHNKTFTPISHSAPMLLEALDDAGKNVQTDPQRYIGTDSPLYRWELQSSQINEKDQSFLVPLLMGNIPTHVKSIQQIKGSFDVSYGTPKEVLLEAPYDVIGEKLQAVELVKLDVCIEALNGKTATFRMSHDSRKLGLISKVAFFDENGNEIGWRLNSTVNVNNDQEKCLRHNLVLDRELPRTGKVIIHTFGDVTTERAVIDRKVPGDEAVKPPRPEEF